MDDLEFLRFEESLRKEFERFGLSDLGDERHYRLEGMDGPSRLLPPRERVLAELRALDRLLMLHDRKVYDQSMADIEAVLRKASGKGASSLRTPRDAVVVLPENSPGVEREHSLGDLTDLTEPRRRLAELIRSLEEDL